MLARDGNRIVERRDPTPMPRCSSSAPPAQGLGNERLAGTVLYVSLEPCAMCVGAFSLARVARLVFAAEDPKGGAVLHGRPRFFEQPTCHHRPEVAAGGRRGGSRAAAQVVLSGPPNLIPGRRQLRETG